MFDEKNGIWQADPPLYDCIMIGKKYDNDINNETIRIIIAIKYKVTSHLTNTKRMQHFKFERENDCTNLC